MNNDNKSKKGKKKSLIEMISDQREKRIEEEVKRDEFQAQLNEWKLKGIDVEKLEEIIDSDVNLLEKEFMNFKKGVEEGIIKSNFEYEKIKDMKEKNRKDMGLEASIFIREIYSKMRSFKPDYSPLGYYLGDENWNVELSKDVFSLTGKAGRLFRELFRIQCDYIISPDTLQNEIIEIRKLAKEMKNKNQFLVKCLVVDGHDSISERNYFKNFIDRNISIYLLDLSENTLFYNDGDWKTKLFSEWFKKDRKPKFIRELIKEIEDKNGIFSIERMVSDLNFNKERAKKFLEKLEEKNKVISISESKGEYAFVKGLK